MSRGHCWMAALALALIAPAEATDDDKPTHEGDGTIGIGALPRAGGEAKRGSSCGSATRAGGTA